jgi:putative endonuclease
VTRDRRASPGEDPVRVAVSQGKRPSTTARGQAGEQRAVEFLRASGLQVIERNYRCALGELDLVARDAGDVLVFVEVRSRSRRDRGSALETVSAAKQRQVARVAAHYLAARRPTARGMRFDVVGITGDDIVHVRDAFRL